VSSLNESHKRHLLAECQHADKLLSDIEAILTAAASKAAFPRYRSDLSPRQAKVIQDYIARIRAQMVHALKAFDLQPPEPSFEAVHSIRTILTFLDIAFTELRPKYLRGYGEVPESAEPELHGLAEELEAIVARLGAYLAGGLGQDLEARLERLSRTGDEIELLKILERIISEHGLVEFRATLTMILDRLESPSFEIAVFGRVNSGKSSLLNFILAEAVLPVGVNPMTAVPTRLVHGTEPRLTVRFADRGVEQYNVASLAEFAAEQYNPGNARHVTNLVVELPSAKLRDGVVFVDTPGLGSLATAGAAETMAYLPRCDLGVVLIDAGSTLTEEDLRTIQSLYEAGIPATVLLSKADLLGPADRSQAIDYIAGHIFSDLGLRLQVRPVSVRSKHAALVDQWFEQEILPLYERHRQLAEESLRRKIGALRDALEGALQSKSRRAAPQAEDAALREAETQLRRAAGRVQETLYLCEQLAAEVAHKSEAAIEWAAFRVIQGAQSPSEALIESALIQAAGEKTQSIRRAIQDLAEELAKALEDAAAKLRLEEPPAAEDLAALLREMPRPGLESAQLDVRPGWLASVSKWLALRQARARLQEQIGPAVNRALFAYARVLEAWARRTVQQLGKRFHAQADAYRAQFDRIAGAGEALAPEQEAAVRRDLEALAGSPR
jgi:GTP-binding protein EngB required for normal cell division